MTQVMCGCVHVGKTAARWGSWKQVKLVLGEEAAVQTGKNKM